MLRKSISYTTVVVALAGCGGLDPTELGTFERGTAALEESRWTDARGAFDELLDGRPDYAPAQLRRAEACLHLDELEIALADLEAIVESGALPAPETGYAQFLRGRCLVESGRRLIDDTAFRARAAPLELARRARETFMAANVAFRRASEIAPRHYDTLLWRAYALYRQENYQRALEILRDCDTIAPGDWRHRFFRVLAAEGVQGLDTKAVEQVLDVVTETPSRDTLPVIVYLIDIYDEVPALTARRIERVVEAFRLETGLENEHLAAFLRSVDDDRVARERKLETSRTLQRARELASAEQYETAIRTLAHFRERRGRNAEIDQLRRQLSERWSSLLEVSSAPLVQDGSPARLHEALQSYRSAHDLTDDVDRRITLLKKIAMVEDLLHQHGLGDRLVEASELRERGQHARALALVDRLPLSRLGKKNRNKLHFERGSALFHLKRWNDAAAAFAHISPESAGDFDQLAFLHGWSLVRANHRDAGVRLLETTPAEQRDDAVNRLVATQLAKSKRFDDALSFLAAIEERELGDARLEATSRKLLGIELFHAREYSKAIQQLAQAAEIFRTVLNEAPVETLAFLGKAHHRRGQLDLARDAFEEFARTSTARADQVRFRDVFLSLGRLRLKDKEQRAAFEALEAYRDLGGTFPSDLSAAHARLVATFADFLPIENVFYWRYERVSPDGKQSFDVVVRDRDRDRGRYMIERREGELVLEEEWQLEENVLVRRSGRAEFRLPTRLLEGDEELPSLDYENGGQKCVARIIGYDDRVDIAPDRSFLGCLRIETVREVAVPHGELQRIRQIIWLAPGVGEVRRQLFEDDTPVTTIELQEVEFRTQR